MTKKQYWELANAQALFHYDAIFSSLESVVGTDQAQSIAMSAYNAVIQAKTDEYQTQLATKRYAKREKTVKATLVSRQENNSRPLHRRFWSWLTTSKPLYETSSIKLASECAS